MEQKLPSLVNDGVSRRARLFVLVGRDEEALDQAIQSLLDRGIRVLEHPDAKKHPALHGAIADEAMALIRTTGEPVVIRTHSQVLIERCRRRHRSGEWDEASWLTIWVGQEEVFPLLVDEEGEWVTAWPGGYFSEVMKELLTEN